MNTKQYSLLVGVIFVAIIVVVVAFVQFWQLRGDSNGNGEPISEENGDPVDEAYRPDRIEALHQIKNGRHIVAGEIELPTPCHILDADVVVRESDPEQVTLEFGTRVDETVELCAQVMTPNRFKLEFQASDEALIDATFNGASIEIELTVVEEDEMDLDEFDIYTKG